jgi:DNA topoisomerase-1
MRTNFDVIRCSIAFQFDFLGKDSIRFLNTVEVELPVYQAIKEFCAGNSPALFLYVHLCLP